MQIQNVVQRPVPNRLKSSSMSFCADRVSMRWPFFSMRKQPTADAVVYSEAGKFLRINPSERGAPTVWDRDVVIYMASLVRAAEFRTRRLSVSAHDILRSTGRGTGIQGYRSLMNALFRLRHTKITTNIGTPDGKVADIHWLDDYTVERKATPSGRIGMSGLTITLSAWSYANLVGEHSAAIINPDYFRLTGGLQRRLYELAVDQCQDRPEWTIGLRALAKETGSNQCNLRRFKFDLKAIIAERSLPDHRVELLESFENEDRVQFTADLQCRRSAA